MSIQINFEAIVLYSFDMVSVLVLSIESPYYSVIECMGRSLLVQRVKRPTQLIRQSTDVDSRSLAQKFWHSWPASQI